MPRLYVAHSATDVDPSMRFEQGDKSQTLFIVDDLVRPGAEDFVILTAPLSYKGQLKRGKRIEMDDGIAWGLVIRDESHLVRTQDIEQLKAIRSLNSNAKATDWYPLLFCYTALPLPTC